MHNRMEIAQIWLIISELPGNCQVVVHRNGWILKNNIKICCTISLHTCQLIYFLTEFNRRKKNFLARGKKII
jgi:hypothetical protein